MSVLDRFNNKISVGTRLVIPDGKKGKRLRGKMFECVVSKVDNINKVIVLNYDLGKGENDMLCKDWELTEKELQGSDWVSYTGLTPISRN